MLRYMNIISGFFLLQIAPVILTSKTKTTDILRLTIDPGCHGKEAGTFVKDPYSCDKFYYCESGERAIVVDCPHGMIFNDEKEICDFPSNYNCIPRINPEEENVSITTAKPQSTISVQKGNEKTTSKVSLEFRTSPRVNSNPTALTSVITPEAIGRQSCPRSDTKSLMFLRHPNDCNRYYICYHGVPLAQECITELHWNAKTNRCDLPENSGCLVSTVAPTTVTLSIMETISCPFRGEQIFPHPVNCNYFIFCINGYATVQQCPFYHYFDIRSRRCLWRTVATCMSAGK